MSSRQVMCGIAGILQCDRTPVNKAVLRSMSEAIQHRGPDDRGYLGLTADFRLFQDKDPKRIPDSWVALAHRRLSILDLTEEAWQPMISEDRRYVIVYNGEVYNYVVLRTDLKRLGHRFRSRSDTEVVLHAYIEWGKDALEKFVGMFALAILDLKKNKLFLARDHFGIKPLYYASGGGFFAFASEIKAILRIPSVSRQADPQIVFNYLRYGRTSYNDATFFASVMQVPPATYLEVPFETGLTTESGIYWQPNVHEPMDLSFTEAARGLKDLLFDSVGIHLRSDVPVGMALSGGIDSSSITACVKRLQPDVQLNTFTYVSDERLEREWPYAAKVADHVDAFQYRIHPCSEDLLGELDKLVYMQDQPVRNTNMFAQYIVYKIASQHGIKVLLDGQGADELMAGYAYFYIPLVKSMIKRGEWLKLVRFLREATSH